MWCFSIVEATPRIIRIARASSGSSTCDALEAAGQRRVFLDVLLVLGEGGRADRAQLAARQRGLEQVGRVARAGCAAGADQRVGLVDEQDDGLDRRLHFVDHRAQALLELALHARAGLQQAHVEHAQLHVLQRRRHVAARDALGKTFDHGRLAHAGFADQDRVVLAPPHQDVDDLADLVVAADDRVHLAAARLLGQVGRELLQGLLLAHRRGPDGPAGFAGLGAALARRLAFFGRTAEQRVEVLRQIVDLDALELLADRQQHVAQRLGLEQADDQVTGAHLRAAEHQRTVDPGALDRVFDERRQVGDRGGAARQPVERVLQVGHQHRRVDAVVLGQAVQVGVLRLQDLEQPVLQFHERVAAQLAEHERTFDRLVRQRVELAEERGATDFSHGVSL